MDAKDQSNNMIQKKCNLKANFVNFHVLYVMSLNFK